jgi:uncharacterized protein YkwD
VVIGVSVVAAVAAISASAIVFQGRDEPAAVSTHSGATSTTGRPTTTSSTTSTTSTTTSTTLPAPATTSPPPPPTAPPAPIEVAPPPPPPPPVCDGGGSAVIDAMNTDRATAGLGALCASSALTGYAQSWANWMAENSSLTHQSMGNILAGTTFNAVAENILDGPAGMTSWQMEGAWMASPTHRENILNGTYTAAGVGMATSSDGRIWVAVEFGG